MLTYVIVMKKEKMIRNIKHGVRIFCVSVFTLDVARMFYEEHQSKRYTCPDPWKKRAEFYLLDESTNIVIAFLSLQGQFVTSDHLFFKVAETLSAVFNFASITTNCIDSVLYVALMVNILRWIDTGLFKPSIHFLFTFI